MMQGHSRDELSALGDVLTMLKGDAVELTELRTEDSEVLFRWINNPDVVRFNAPFAPIHEPNHLAWFETITKTPDRIVFAIRRVNSPAILGVLQLINLHPIHRTAELMIRIGEEQDRGRGLGTEAVRLVIDFAFQHRNLQRVWLRVFDTNPRAVRAYERAGLTVEGRLRRSCFIDGTWVDEIIMARLAPMTEFRVAST
jgi:RimJ/RimL family protein N-acetyltransferase